jgi:hypothetical protein
MKEILIGIDDTDNLTSPGTGRLARDLCQELVRRGLKSLGVTRHQFLADSSIPYTSHNSGACIAVESDDIRAVEFAFNYIACISAKGSDPGVCIAFSDGVSEDVFNFGKAAQEKILRIELSFELARNSNIKLRGLGGNCLGVIGALASAGLRSRGNDGRFIDMPGLRELPRKVNSEHFEKIGIELMYKDYRRLPDKNDIYDTLDWARPSLINNKPVLIVDWSEKENAWIPVDRKKSKSSQHSK